MRLMCYPRKDGLVDVLIMGEDNQPIASGVFHSGEEGYVAAREYLKQLEEEQSEPEYIEQVSASSIPG